MDYETQLDRAMAALPEVAAAGERLTVPDARAQSDGAFTRFTNLAEVADALAREADHLHSSVQRSLATAGSLQDGVGRYNGHFAGEDFDGAVADYTAEYVTCSECGLPDTRLVREDRTTMLRCDACGAFRPIKKRRTPTRQKHDDVETGETYTVEITDTGRKGDGVAHRGDYTIFVTGAGVGDVLEIYVENVSGKLAFARPA